MPVEVKSLLIPAGLSRQFNAQVQLGRTRNESVDVRGSAGPRADVPHSISERTQYY